MPPIEQEVQEPEPPDVEEELELPDESEPPPQPATDTIATQISNSKTPRVKFFFIP